MIKMAQEIGLLLIVGYVAFPVFQTQIAAIAPYLLFLVCSLVMIFMMKGRNNPPQEKDNNPDQEDN